MSTGVVLYSSHHISEEELARVIVEAGGVLTPESPAGYFGGLIDGEAYVWAMIIPCYDGVFDSDDNPLNEEDIIFLGQAESLLDGELQTCMYLTIGKTPGSGRLTVRFAHICCQHWPCVVDDNELEGHLFSCEEIERLYREGGTFTGYGQ